MMPGRCGPSQRVPLRNLEKPQSAHLGGSLPSARAALLEFLVDDDPKVRWFTAWAINRADLDSADIVAGLANATFDQDLVVAIYARQALTDLGERASVAIPVIVARAAPDAESDPFLVTGNLQELVPEVPGALAALASLLRHPDSEMRMWAVSRIESCGPDGAGAVPDLVRALSANDSELEPGCLEALAAIGPGANKSLPTITRCLSGDWPREAAWAVASICEGAKKGKEDRTAIRALRQSLREADASYRTPMLYALWVLTGEANGVVPALTCGIKEGNHSDRCLDALASMGPAAREAIPFLEDLRKSKHLTDREAATLALCRIEPRKEIPAQAALLFAEDSTVREAAIQLLLALGPSAQAAVPLIQKRLVQTGPAVRGDGAGLTQGEIEALISERLDLIEVLVNIGPGAEPSIATLQEVQGHDREPAETRDAAAAAIKALRKN